MDTDTIDSEINYVEQEIDRVQRPKSPPRETNILCDEEDRNDDEERDGTLQFDSYASWINCLRAFHIDTSSHYIIGTSTKDFSNDITLEEIIKQPVTPKLRWEYSANEDLLPIPFNGSPYMMLGKQEYHCHQGKDLNVNAKQKRKQEKDNLRKTAHNCIKSRKLIHPTKKLDCPVKFVVKKIFRFSGYKLDQVTRKCKTEMMMEIRDELDMIRKGISKKTMTMGILEYLVILPVEQHKYHHTGLAGTLIQPLDSRVKDFIVKQVKQGCRKPKDIQCRVQGFVTEIIFGGIYNPAASRKTFCPSLRKIRNLIHYVKCETSFPEIFNEDNVENDSSCDETVYDTQSEENIPSVINEGDNQCSLNKSPPSVTLDELHVKRTVLEGLQINVRSNLKQITELTYNMEDKSMLQELDKAVLDCLNWFKRQLYGDNP